VHSDKITVAVVCDPGVCVYLAYNLQPAYRGPADHWREGERSYIDAPARGSSIGPQGFDRQRSHW
jgi:hypothetical protein